LNRSMKIPFGKYRVNELIESFELNLNLILLVKTRVI